MVSDEEALLKLSRVNKYFPEKLKTYAKIAEEQSEVSSLNNCLVYAGKFRTLPKLIELAADSLRDKIHLLDHLSQWLLIERLFEFL